MATPTVEWDKIICARLRHYPCGQVWSDGRGILCGTYEQAKVLVDLLYQLFLKDNKYKPEIKVYYHWYDKDRTDQCADNLIGEIHTIMPTDDEKAGWWEVRADG